MIRSLAVLFLLSGTALAQTSVPEVVTDTTVSGAPSSAQATAPAPVTKESISLGRRARSKPPMARADNKSTDSATKNKAKEESAQIQYQPLPLEKKPAEKRDNSRVQEPEQLTAADALNETSPLRRALAAAYLRNPQLNAQREQQQAIDERVPQALSGALPTATIDYNTGRRRTRYGNTNYDYVDAELKQFNLTQPIFRGGRVYNTTKSARREVAAGRARLQQVEQDVLLNTITAYLDVAQAEALRGLSQKNLSALQQQVTVTGQRFDVGEDTRTDVAQSGARASGAETSLADAEAQLAAGKAAYRKFTGLEPNDRFILPNVLPDLPKSVDDAIAVAKQSNPRILEAQNLKVAADHAIDTSVGTLLPTVSVVGNVRRQDGPGAIGIDELDQDEVLLTVNMPLYQGGANYSRIREAKQTYQQRRFSELDTANDVRRQVTSAWEQLQAARRNLTSNRSAIDSAQQALNGVSEEKKYGARTTRDVLDAEQELFSAETQFIRAQRNEVISAYSLLATMGKLTADGLELRVAKYDPMKHYEDVEYQFIGF